MKCFRYAVPAFLYAVHNNIIFIALMLIDPVTFELFNNLKVIMTAVVFRLMLGRKLRIAQWVGISLLLFAMAVINLQKGQSDFRAQHHQQDIFLGFLWMVILALCSAFAGVYNEFLIKGTTDSLYWTNIQLYFFSTTFCFIKFALANDSATSQDGFFTGFDATAWGVVLLNGVTGQVVSLIFKYADNIVKVYASALTVWGSAIASYVLFDKQLTVSFFLGGGIFMTSMFLYFASSTTLAHTDSEAVARISTFMCRHDAVLPVLQKKASVLSNQVQSGQRLPKEV
jgi:UDP-sugar transporter A1/2/3